MNKHPCPDKPSTKNLNALLHQKKDHITSLLIATTFLSLYCIYAAPFYEGGDGAIFAIIMAEGGHAHAPGYPLYSMYLWVAHLLTNSVGYHAASIATAPIGALAVAVLFIACRVWGISYLSSIAVVGVFGLAPPILEHHTQPEVFALNNLLASLLILTASPRLNISWHKRVLGLGLLAGLGLSHNHTLVLLAPIGIYGVLYGVSQSSNNAKKRGFALLLGISGILLGLLPYLYLNYAQNHRPLAFLWGDAKSLHGMLDLFLRRDYGTFELRANEEGVGPITQWKYLGETWMSAFLYLGPALAFTGMWRTKHSKQRLAWSMLMLSLVCTGPLFLLLVQTNPYTSRFTLDLVGKFHILFILVSTPFIGMGFDIILDLVRELKAKILVASTPLLSAFMLFSLGNHTNREPHAMIYARDVLATMPPGSVLYAVDDHLFLGLQYILRVEKKRPQVSVIAPSRLIRERYHRQVTQRIGVEIPYEENKKSKRTFNLVNFTSHLLNNGVEVFLVDGSLKAGVLATYPSHPQGLLVKIYPRNAKLPAPHKLIVEHERLFRDVYLMPAKQNPKPMTWAHMVLTRYREKWTVFVPVFEQLGLKEYAERCKIIANDYLPSDPK